MHLVAQPNIVVLCNNEMAVPALQTLFGHRVLKAVIVPAKNKDLLFLLQSYMSGTGVPVLAVSRQNLAETVQAIAIEKKVTAFWMMTFPYVIPISLLNAVEGGFINFHYGLLPGHRGVNPILSHLLKHESVAGITVHQVDKNIDEGPIILQQKIPIEEADTFGILVNKLGLLASNMVSQLLVMYQAGIVLPSVAQDESQARYYKKPAASDLMIDWKKMSSTQVVRIINACNPWNKGAGTLIHNWGFLLTHGEKTLLVTDSEPGTIVGLDDEGLMISCSDSKIVKVSIIFTQDGFFPPKKLLEYGIKINDRFLS